METAARQIAELLKRLGRRQSWLARAAGLTPPHLSRLLRGELDARVSTLEKIADVMGARFVLVPHDKLDEVARIVGREAPARVDVGTAFDDLFIAVDPDADGESDTGEGDTDDARPSRRPARQSPEGLESPGPKGRS